MMYNLWIWEGSWRVLASYPAAREAKAAGRHSGDPAGTWTVCKAGSPMDEHLRRHCTERMALRTPIDVGERR